MIGGGEEETVGLEAATMVAVDLEAVARVAVGLEVEARWEVAPKEVADSGAAVEVMEKV